MKTKEEIRSFAEREKAMADQQLAAWAEMARTAPWQALDSAEGAAEMYERLCVAREALKGTAPECKASPDTLLEYARNKARVWCDSRTRSTAILERSRVHARAAAWMRLAHFIETGSEEL